MNPPFYLIYCFYLRTKSATCLVYFWASRSMSLLTFTASAIVMAITAKIINATVIFLPFLFLKFVLVIL